MDSLQKNSCLFFWQIVSLKFCMTTTYLLSNVQKHRCFQYEHNVFAFINTLISFLHCFSCWRVIYIIETTAVRYLFCPLYEQTKVIQKTLCHTNTYVFRLIYVSKAFEVSVDICKLYETFLCCKMVHLLDSSKKCWP